MKYNDYIDWLKNRHESITDFASSVSITDQTSIVVSTDGVGTKLKVAEYLGKYNTIGVDLVAMNVNDILTQGAIPIGFSNYIACDKLDDRIPEIIKGIEVGCKVANCNLLGGETAIMEGSQLELSGFAIGIVHKDHKLPKKETMKRGDPIFGIISSGIHSNGLTIARKYIPKKDWKKLLEPTLIYSGFISSLPNGIIGIAHITGGGFTKIDSILPSNLQAEIYYDWEVPEVFLDLQKKSGLSHKQMTKNFNLGIGMVLIVDQNHAHKFDGKLRRIGELIYG